MKTNKILLLAMASVVAGSAFIACGGNGDDPITPEPTAKLSLKPTTGALEFTPAAASQTITVNCNVASAITGDGASWVTLDTKSGEGTYTVTATVEALPEGTDDRSVVYTVTAGTATKTITVSQVAVVEAGRLVGGVTWATKNVAEPKKFAKLDTDPGYVYKFNTQKGYVPPKDLANDAEASPADWDDSYPGPGDWTKANDPCPTGWHVPSLSEWTGSLLAVADAPGGRLLAASAEELSAGANKDSEWVVYLPLAQSWGSTHNGATATPQEHGCENGSASRYWTSSEYTGTVPEDPSGACAVDYSKATDYMAHRIFMYSGGGTWGSGWTYSADTEVAAREGVSWNDNLNKAHAYGVRCIKD